MVMNQQVAIEDYFRPGTVCEVLGMKLIHDPKRAKREFPQYPDCRLPQVFVVEVGAMAEALGLGEITPKDAFWLVGGDPARYRAFPIDSIPSFINALASMHEPSASAKVVWVFGEDKEPPIKKGFTIGGQFHMSDAEAAELIKLRDALMKHAYSHGLPWREPKRHYDGKWYLLHLLKRGIPAYLKRRHGDACAVTDMPVHEQYFFALLMEVHRRAPCNITIRLDDTHVEVLSCDEKLNETSQTLTMDSVMKTLQVGSIFWLRRYITRWERKSPKFLNGNPDKGNACWIETAQENGDTFNIRSSIFEKQA